MKQKLFHRKTIIISVILLVVLIAVSTFFISNYFKKQPLYSYAFNQNISQGTVSYPDTQFAVMSDLHFYNNELGTTGSAFEEVLLSDRKLLKDSSDLLNLAIDKILKTDSKFVLISGDLTKDGELANHQKVAATLSRLTQGGKKVFVVPGNHDVNNPMSFKYEGDHETLIPNISKDQFAEIYRDYGFGSAIYRDESTLSYVAEPEPNLWLIALDSCRSAENKAGTEEIVAGKLQQNQEKWLEEMLKKASQSGKAVVVMQHHGIVEHWGGQGKLHTEYLIQDYPYISKMLASYNVRIAFTGHYHAQDISVADYNKLGFIYDIETGSLITAPCPFRTISIVDNKMKIDSTSLVSSLHPNTDFASNADQFVFDTIYNEAVKKLKNFKVSDKDAKDIANYAAASFIAHYKGDEDATHRPSFDEKKLSLWGRVIYSQQKFVIDGLWKDLLPADNAIILDLGAR